MVFILKIIVVLGNVEWKKTQMKNVYVQKRDIKTIITARIVNNDL